MAHLYTTVIKKIKTKKNMKRKDKRNILMAYGGMSYKVPERSPSKTYTKTAAPK